MSGFKRDKLELIRQLDIIPPEVLGEQVTIIGAGAIGGWTTLCLAKMGISNITVFDSDIVTAENMNSQFFRTRDIGVPKVVALKELVEDFTGVRIEAHNRLYTGERAFPGIVISAVDSMAVRSQIWASHKGIGARTRAIIDPRMGAMTALMYTVRPMIEADAKWYEKTLYSDIDATQERCTAKATVFCANLLAGMVVKTVKNLLVDGVYPKCLTWDVNADQFEVHRSEGL